MSELEPMPQQVAINRVGNVEWQKVFVPNPGKKPDWLHTLEIEWTLTFDNMPSFKATTNRDPLEFTDKEACWVKSGSSYVCLKDGCLQVHYHGGPLHWDDEQQAWLTTQEQGYGGRHFPIMMALDSDPRFTEGRNKVILRGPWHGSPPAGFTSVSTKPAGSNNCYCFGLEVHNPIVAAAFGMFFPDHTLHLVRKSRKERGKTVWEKWFLEPFKPWQEVPRYVLTDRRINIAYARPKDFPSEYRTLLRGHDGYVYMIVEQNRNGLDIVRLDVLDYMATKRSISESAIGKTFHKTDDRI